jgi:sirohydrochlorin ferrochelatase
MRVIVIGLLASVLSACAPAVRDIEIAKLDLADGRTLAQLQQKLPLDERAALGTYALLHWPQSKFYCGRPIGGQGSVATTVGEAIDQTRAYEASLALARASASTNAALAIRSEETGLITRIEQLVLERDMLFAQAGPAAASTPRAADIKSEITALRLELEQLRARRTT